MPMMSIRLEYGLQTSEVHCSWDIDRLCKDKPGRHHVCNAYDGMGSGQQVVEPIFSIGRLHSDQRGDPDNQPVRGMLVRQPETVVRNRSEVTPCYFRIEEQTNTIDGWLCFGSRMFCSSSGSCAEMRSRQII
jgi:hypothetical protein